DPISETQKSPPQPERKRAHIPTNHHYSNASSACTGTACRVSSQLPSSCPVTPSLSAFWLSLHCRARSLRASRSCLLALLISKLTLRRPLDAGNLRDRGRRQGPGYVRIVETHGVGAMAGQLLADLDRDARTMKLSDERMAQRVE